MPLLREPGRKIIGWYFYILWLDRAKTVASAYITVTLLAMDSEQCFTRHTELDEYIAFLKIHQRHPGDSNDRTVDAGTNGSVFKCSFPDQLASIFLDFPRYS